MRATTLRPAPWRILNALSRTGRTNAAVLLNRQEAAEEDLLELAEPRHVTARFAGRASALDLRQHLEWGRGLNRVEVALSSSGVALVEQPSNDVLRLLGGLTRNDMAMRVVMELTDADRDQISTLVADGLIQACDDRNGAMLSPAELMQRAAGEVYLRITHTGRRRLPTPGE